VRLARITLALAEQARIPARRRLPESGGVVFALAAGAAAVAVPFGVMASPTAAVMALLNWGVPLAFGWYVAVSAPPEEVERAVSRVLRTVPIVVGAYGVWQFLAPQPWDAEWMRQSEMTTIGRPEPFEVRVFSTMHSPGVLGFFLIVPLVLWLARPTVPGLPAACLAGVTLVLSQVRTAWLGLAVSTAFVLLIVPARVRIRMLALGAVAILCITPFLVSPDVAELASARFATLAEPDDDASALSRLEGHLLAFDFVATHPLGVGLGGSEPRIEQVISLNDSVIVSTLVQFGVLGALAYGLSLVLSGLLLWRYYTTAPSLEGAGLACAGLGLLATVGLGVATAGPPGVLFWLITGVAAARERSRVPQSAPVSGVRTPMSSPMRWPLAEAPATAPPGGHG
jgi:O-Antigen ligase